MCIKIKNKVCIFYNESILNLIYVTEKNFHYISNSVRKWNGRIPLFKKLHYITSFD